MTKWKLVSLSPPESGLRSKLLSMHDFSPVLTLVTLSPFVGHGCCAPFPHISACLSISVFSPVYFMLLKLVVCLFVDFFFSIYFYYQNKIGECKSDGEWGDGDGLVGWRWWVWARQDRLTQYMNKERISLPNIWIKRGSAYPIYE